jgi:hypothetical protein
MTDRSSDGFDVDVGGLTDRAGQFDGLVDRLGTIERDLTDALSATGSCWGTDAVGQSFAAAHADPADATLGRLAGLSEQLGSVGGRFADTATGYSSSDDAGAEHVTAVDPDV